MDKAYVITSGDYSDYRIDGVFSSKEKAEDFIKMFKGHAMDIEEWDLDPLGQDYKGKKAYFVRMAKDGTTLRVDIEDSSYGFTHCNRDGFSIDKDMFTHVIAKDVRHAVKIANERRTALIANNEWKD